MWKIWVVPRSGIRKDTNKCKMDLNIPLGPSFCQMKTFQEFREQTSEVVQQQRREREMLAKQASQQRTNSAMELVRAKEVETEAEAENQELIDKVTDRVEKRIRNQFKSEAVMNPLNRRNFDSEQRQELDKEREFRDERRKIRGQFQQAARQQQKQMQNEEAYDADMRRNASVTKTGGRTIGKDRLNRPDPSTGSGTRGTPKRMKAVGGGKQEPVYYKGSKTAGTPKGSNVSQQPTKPIGSDTEGMSTKEKLKAQQQKARAERLAAAGRAPKTSKEKEKAGSSLMSKAAGKPKPKVDPNYKPAKASGMSRAERTAMTQKGERMLSNIMKDQETAKYKQETGVAPDKKGKMKISGRVAQRMKS